MYLIKNIGTAVLLAALLGGCGTSNFMVYNKTTGKHFFVNSTKPEIKKYLCDSGDLDTILKDSTLPADLRKDLMSSLCATEKVKEKVMSVLENMTKEQRNELQMSFQRNGYDVNAITC
jgi:hypothetical protein